MSISGAVAELNKEIERLIKIRDSLVQGASETATRATVAAAPLSTAKKPVGRKPGPKKTAAVKKSVSAEPTAPVAKRVMSAATRKKMSDSAKARAAAKATAAK
jgi:hypothetical protein